MCTEFQWRTAYDEVTRTIKMITKMDLTQIIELFTILFPLAV
jgi:hypothetical protein